MSYISCSAERADHLPNLRRLVTNRWFVLGAMAVLVLVTPSALDIPLQQGILLGIIGVTALFNSVVQWRVSHAKSATLYELFSQLLIDLAAVAQPIRWFPCFCRPLPSLP